MSLVALLPVLLGLAFAAGPIVPDEELIGLIEEVSKKPPLSEEQKARIERFAHEVAADDRPVLSDFLKKHRDKKAARRFEAAVGGEEKAFHERVVSALNAALGDRGYAMPLEPVKEGPGPLDLRRPSDDFSFMVLMFMAEAAPTPERRIHRYTQALNAWTAEDGRKEKAMAHFNRAIASLDLGRADQAVSDFSAVLALKAFEKEALYARGLALSMLGRKRKALADFTSAIRIDPAFSDAYINRGTVLGDLKERKMALEDFARAISLDPRNPFSLIARAELYIETGRSAEAIADLEAAVKLSTDSALSYSNLGFGFLEAGRDGEASSAFLRALELDPDYPQPYAGLAVAAHRAGDISRSTSTYARAIALEPLFERGPGALKKARHRVRMGAAGRGWEEYAFSEKTAKDLEAILRRIHALRPRRPK